MTMTSGFSGSPSCVRPDDAFSVNIPSEATYPRRSKALMMPPLDRILTVRSNPPLFDTGPVAILVFFPSTDSVTQKFLTLRGMVCAPLVVECCDELNLEPVNIFCIDALPACVIVPLIFGRIARVGIVHDETSLLCELITEHFIGGLECPSSDNVDTRVETVHVG